MSTNASARRFECTSGCSNKFWEIRVQGNQVMVRFGRNGTRGQTETKTFPDALTAIQQAEKQVAEKLRKGYVEVI
jgi:predicted DNA-binding WGR domain protein